MWWYNCGYVLRVHGGVHVCCICLCKSVYVCMYKCMHDYKCVSIVYAWLCVFMYILVYICIRVCTCAFMYTCGYMCWLYVTAMQTCSCTLNSVTEPRPSLDLCSLWTRYTGDSKISPWDDPEIRIGSCSGDRMVIRLQNRIISCECLFIGLFQF